jgi:hypothetical protein
MRLRPLLAVCAGLVAVAGSAHALATRGAADRDRRSTAVVARTPADAGLRVTGRVRGLLYPGVRRRLRVRVTNRRRHPVIVTEVRAGVTRASRGCPRRTLALGRFRGRLRVGARRSRRLDLPARLRATAPDSCQAAVFRLGLRARAQRPGGR